MFQAKSLKIFPRNKKQFRILQRRGRRRVSPAVENRQFRKGTARALYRENLLATGRRQLEDAYLAVGHQIQTLAVVSFVEQQFTASKSFAGHMDRKRGRLGVGQASEEWGLAEDLFDARIHA